MSAIALLDVVALNARYGDALDRLILPRGRHPFTGRVPRAGA